MWYADGTALLQFFVPDAEWLSFSETEDVVISEVSITEFRAGAVGYSAHQRSAGLDWLAGFEVIRIPDQALGVATMSTSVLQPLAAIHLGVAATNKHLSGLVTYDQRLAAVAHLHRIRVHTPGRLAKWWEIGSPNAQSVSQ